MKIITASLVSVMRARREMERAFAQGDWNLVKTWDKKVGEYLDAAFDDPDRDNRILVDELEKILKLYGDMVTHLPEEAAQQWLRKPGLLV